MITSATFERFKRLKHLELPDMARVTLIGGRNNTGKTSVLEGLFMFFDRTNPQLLVRQFGWRGLSTFTTDPGSLWGPAFYGYDLKQAVRISVVHDQKRRESLQLEFLEDDQRGSVAASLPRMNQRDRPSAAEQTFASPFSVRLTYTKGAAAKTALLVLRGDQLELNAKNLERPKFIVIFMGSRMRTDPNEDAQRFGKMDVEGNTDIVLRFLQIVEPKLVDLSSVAMGERSVIHGDIGIGRKIPVIFMGDGTSRLLSIILAIATAKNGVVFVDEIESSLHFSVMSRVWQAIDEAAKRFDCQVIATTHDDECLKAAYTAFDEPERSDSFRYIRIDAAEDELTAKSYSHEVLGAAIERGWEVR